MSKFPRGIAPSSDSIQTHIKSTGRQFENFHTPIYKLHVLGAGE